ncbi:hypothetical protein OGAPHI_006104 [Ogataea philodendri]|uniref:Uncharacterized protein n=1 Tax=Ogataea philodendri TaxID=1378263 RepID=A0A9P8T1G5_9ASCO|nr:uncharacterized protein OGAPHI_006104 [Ogataea philodendri]KAH3661925.1 hypothetical protein OGAPHI_006104 [Ogataea philodendri]
MFANALDENLCLFSDLLDGNRIEQCFQQTDKQLFLSIESGLVFQVTWTQFHLLVNLLGLLLVCDVVDDLLDLLVKVIWDLLSIDEKFQNRSQILESTHTVMELVSNIHDRVESSGYSGRDGNRCLFRKSLDLEQGLDFLVGWSASLQIVVQANEVVIAASKLSKKTERCVRMLMVVWQRSQVFPQSLHDVLDDWLQNRIEILSSEIVNAEFQRSQTLADQFLRAIQSIHQRFHQVAQMRNKNTQSDRNCQTELHTIGSLADVVYSSDLRINLFRCGRITASLAAWNKFTDIKHNLNSRMRIFDLMMSMSPSSFNFDITNMIRIPEKFDVVVSLARKNCGMCNRAAFFNIDSNIISSCDWVTSLNAEGSR